MSEQFGLTYAVPSFWEGVARSIDIGDTLTEYNVSESGAAADFRALRADWKAVGSDLASATRRYAEEQTSRKG